MVGTVTVGANAVVVTVSVGIVGAVGAGVAAAVAAANTIADVIDHVEVAVVFDAAATILTNIDTAHIRLFMFVLVADAAATAAPIDICSTIMSTSTDVSDLG